VAAVTTSANVATRPIDTRIFLGSAGIEEGVVGWVLGLLEATAGGTLDADAVPGLVRDRCTADGSYRR
jgi:hypothetical protein